MHSVYTGSYPGAETPKSRLLPNVKASAMAAAVASHALSSCTASYAGSICGWTNQLWTWHFTSLPFCAVRDLEPDMVFTVHGVDRRPRRAICSMAVGKCACRQRLDHAVYHVLFLWCAHLLQCYSILVPAFNWSMSVLRRLQSMGRSCRTPSNAQV